MIELWTPEDDAELLQLSDLIEENKNTVMLDWEDFKSLIANNTWKSKEEVYGDEWEDLLDGVDPA